MRIVSGERREPPQTTVKPPERPLLPRRPVQGQAPGVATSPPTILMVSLLTTLLSTTGEIPHSTIGGMLLVLVVIIGEEVVVVVVVLVVVVVDVVVIFSAQHKDKSFCSKPHGDLIAARRYLRRD